MIDELLGEILERVRVERIIDRAVSIFRQSQEYANFCDTNERAITLQVRYIDVNGKVAVTKVDIARM